MASNNIANAVIGGILTGIGSQLFNKTHKKALNFSNVVWSLTCMKQSQIFYVFPLVSGIFITSGILFDWMRYQGFGKMVPFGLQQNILTRTSMYGFAVSGFFQGIGSKMVGGDLFFFMINEVVKRNWFFILIIAFSLVSAILASFLLDTRSLDFLTNQNMNPLMQSMHMLSANVTIGLGVILCVIAVVIMIKKNKSFKSIAKRVGFSFLSGVILTFGAGMCGLSHRNLVFNSLTPGPNWDPVLLVFLTTYIITSLLIHSVVSARLQVKTISRILTSSEITKTNRSSSRINRLVGAVLVGIGWGTGGIDLLAYLMHSAIFTVPTVIIFGGFLILGTMIGDAIILQ